MCVIISNYIVRNSSSIIAYKLIANQLIRKTFDDTGTYIIYTFTNTYMNLYLKFFENYFVKITE